MRLPSDLSISSVDDNVRLSRLVKRSVTVELSVSATQGGRRYMEDRVHVKCARTASGGVDYVFLDVFDGHGGAEASQFAKEHLRKIIVSKPHFHYNDDESVLKAIKEGFMETHLSMWKDSESWPCTISGYPSTAGTTASIAIIKNGKIYTGHIGDSAIVINRADVSPSGSGFDQSMTVMAQKITVDHKPDNVEESKRILNTGGQVATKAGVARVVWSRPSRGHRGPVRRSTSIEKVPFLAVSRSLGDLWSYNAAVGQFVVSPEPEVCCFDIDPTCVSLIIGSDGLWNVMKPSLAAEFMQINESTHSRPTNGDMPKQSVNHALLLMRSALMSWGTLRADNITVITVRFIPTGDETAKFHRVTKSEVLVEHPDLCIDSLLIVCPSATVVRIDEHTTYALKTSKIDLDYFGVTDINHVIHQESMLNASTLTDQSNPLVFRGPGYHPVNHGTHIQDDWSTVCFNLEECFIDQREVHNESQSSLSLDFDHCKLLMATKDSVLVSDQEAKSKIHSSPTQKSARTLQGRESIGCHEVIAQNHELLRDDTNDTDTGEMTGVSDKTSRSFESCNGNPNFNSQARGFFSDRKPVATRFVLKTTVTRSVYTLRSSAKTRNLMTYKRRIGSPAHYGTQMLMPLSEQISCNRRQLQTCCLSNTSPMHTTPATNLDRRRQRSQRRLSLASATGTRNDHRRFPSVSVASKSDRSPPFIPVISPVKIGPLRCRLPKTSTYHTSLSRFRQQKHQLGGEA